MLGFEAFVAVLGDSYYLGRIWFTTWQALISTIFTLMVGLPVAYFFVKYEFHGKTFIKSLSTVPFVLPTVVVALGFVALFGPRGTVNTVLMQWLSLETPPIRLMSSLSIIFIAHVFYNYSVVVRIVSGFWANLDPSIEETAKMLGASRIKIFVQITLPLLKPAIISAALLTFMFSFTSFGVVLILGGSQFSTIEVTIYELTAKLFKLPIAGALAIIQLIFTYLSLFIYARIQKNHSVQINLKPKSISTHRRLRFMDRIFFFMVLTGLLVILSPLFALLEQALSTGDGYTLSNIHRLFSNDGDSYFHLSPINIVWNSLRFGLATVAISLLLGTIVAYFLTRKITKNKSVIDAIFMMPLGVSAITLGFGFMVALNKPPLDLRGSWMMLVIAHSLVAYPFVIRSIVPVLQAIPSNLRDAASMMGASPVRIFIWIDLPIIAPALLVGATFAFAISIGEFGASMILVRSEFTTIPVAIFQFLGKPGGVKLGEALAMSNLLVAVMILSFVAIEKFRFKGVGTF